LEARQLKASLLNYMESEKFNPQINLSVIEVQKITKEK